MTNTQEKTINYEKLSNDIVSWLKDYVVNAKLDCLVWGTSGGIDSAVIGALCAKTGLKCYTYSIPVNSHKENNDNAEKQLNFLLKNYPNVTTGTYDLSMTYSTFLLESGTKS